MRNIKGKKSLKYVLAIIVMGVFMFGSLTVKAGPVILEDIEEPKEWKHVFYAINSASQMHLIPNYDAVSFGWAYLQAKDNTFNVVTTDSTNDFKVPLAFERPLDLAKEHGVTAHLMIYFENTNQEAALFLNNEKEVDKVINQIVEYCKGIEKDGVIRSFDGVTIDFENFINESLKDPYTAFLQKLKVALLKEEKSLYVAVQPATYFKGYDYKRITEVVDRIILMAHDYEPKRLLPFERDIADGMTPLTPINQVVQALKEITDEETGTAQKEKIALQISFASAQWQIKDGKVLHDRPYRPTYDKIASRLLKEETQIYYNTFYESSYAIYEENGIKNIIWYESTRSIEEKIKRAKALGIYGVSYWRLGLLPEGEHNVF